MRSRLSAVSFALGAVMVSACALVAKSPALSSPLRDRLSRADSPTIEDAAKACFTAEGWTPDDMNGEAEGATVVSARNVAKSRVSVYVQPPGSTPRVTGDPPYDDPFWSCLDRQLARGATAAPPAAPSP